MILYEIQDIRRCPHVHDFVSYARLVKRAKESARPDTQLNPVSGLESAVEDNSRFCFAAIFRANSSGVMSPNDMCVRSELYSTRHSSISLRACWTDTIGGHAMRRHAMRRHAMKSKVWVVAVLIFAAAYVGSAAAEATACPVTVVNEGNGGNYQNDVLRVGLWSHGRIVFRPDGRHE